MSKTTETIIDFDDTPRKRQVMSRVGTLTGKWFVSFRPVRAKRSLKANAYYWAVVVPSMRAFMADHGQHFHAEEVHEFFLAMFASKQVIDPKTGEVISVVGTRSSKMDSAQFAAFVDQCITWLADRFGVLVPDPNTFVETAKAKR